MTSAQCSRLRLARKAYGYNCKRVLLRSYRTNSRYAWPPATDDGALSLIELFPVPAKTGRLRAGELVACPASLRCTEQRVLCWLGFAVSGSAGPEAGVRARPPRAAVVVRVRRGCAGGAPAAASGQVIAAGLARRVRHRTRDAGPLGLEPRPVAGEHRMR